MIKYLRNELKGLEPTTRGDFFLGAGACLATFAFLAVCILVGKL